MNNQTNANGLGLAGGSSSEDVDVPVQANHIDQGEPS
jgi:hypothetical protein